MTGSNNTLLRVVAENGVEYAYRDVGEGDVPLVLLQHFRGNLDNWDPALVDALAADRRVVSFDNVGVGATTGTTPNTVEAMAHGAIAFLEAMSFETRGSARLLDRQLRRARDRPHPARPPAARRARVLGTAGRGRDARLGAGGDRRRRSAGNEPGGIPRASSSPRQTRAAKQAQQAAGRIFGRTANRDEPTTWQTRQAQYDAVCAWGIPNHSLLQRVAAIDLPVFVANGDSDPMILPRYSYLLGRASPGRPPHHLPGLGPRLPVPAPQPVRGRRQRVPRGGRLMSDHRRGFADHHVLPSLRRGAGAVRRHQGGLGRHRAAAGAVAREPVGVPSHLGPRRGGRAGGRHRPAGIRPLRRSPGTDRPGQLGRVPGPPDR